MKARLKQGDTVRVELRHWLRGNQVGQLAEYDTDLQRWLVNFPNGWLYLEERQLEREVADETT